MNRDEGAENLPETAATGAARRRNKPVWAVRAAVLGGFAALLVLMAILCADSLLTLSGFEKNNVQIQQDFLYRERTLEQVRAALYDSSNALRDYLDASESDSETQAALRAELGSLEDSTSAALRGVVQYLPPLKRSPFEQLSARMDDYWAVVRSAVSAGQEKGAARSADLRRDALAIHAEILAITQDASGVNDDDLKEANRATADVFSQFRRRLLLVTVVGCLFGVALAAATVAYVGRLESRVAKKYEESLQAQLELKKLSQRLVTAGEDERRTISRELHDEVGQALTAMLVDVKRLAEIEEAGPAFRQELENVKTLAQNSVNQVRNMALLLRPSMLDDLGLVAALEWQAREVSKRTGMRVETAEENVSEDLPEPYRTCVYRAVQEALTNSSKHAEAKNVRVTVRQEANQLRVSVEDDGKGFDAARVRGMGLVGMKERVNQLGGTLEVDSQPGHGTRLRVDLPLPQALSNGAAAVRQANTGA